MNLAGDPDFERGRQAARRMMASRHVTVRGHLVVRESDGRTLLLVSTHTRTRLLAIQVVEEPDGTEVSDAHPR